MHRNYVCICLCVMRICVCACVCVCVCVCRGRSRGGSKGSMEATKVPITIIVFTLYWALLKDNSGLNISLWRLSVYILRM